MKKRSAITGDVVDRSLWLRKLCRLALLDTNLYFVSTKALLEVFGLKLSWLPLVATLIEALSIGY